MSDVPPTILPIIITSGVSWTELGKTGSYCDPTNTFGSDIFDCTKYFYGMLELEIKTFKLQILPRCNPLNNLIEHLTFEYNY